MTRIFVPIFREFSPDKNPRALGAGLVEIPDGELISLIRKWNTFKTNAANGQTSIADWFCKSTKEICSTTSGTIRPFLQRPAITVNCGARDGNDPAFLKVAEEIGWLVAENGFSLVYGGGDKGMMGAVLRGFNKYIEEHGRRPGQYSIQVVPAKFVTNDFESVNGLKPPNECLCEGSDIAVIWPEFEARQWMSLLRGHAVITLPGGDGTMGETYAVKTNLKTGLHKTHLYVVNTEVDGEGYYDPLIALSKKMTKYGFQAPEAEKLWRFVSTPQDVFDDLMPRLKEENRLPDDHYEKHYVRDIEEFITDHDRAAERFWKAYGVGDVAVTAQASCGEILPRHLDDKPIIVRDVVPQDAMISREAVGARAEVSSQDKLTL